MGNQVSRTIRLSNTVDQFARRVHINVRHGKVTMVYRWKDHYSPKSHTQRMTLTDEQAGRLLNALSTAAAHAIEQSGNVDRAVTYLNALSGQ